LKRSNNNKNVNWEEVFFSIACILSYLPDRGKNHLKLTVFFVQPEFRHDNGVRHL
jgi:hypothetical protein